MRLRACVGCLGPGTSRAGSQNLGRLLVSYWPLAAGFQHISSQAEKFTRNGFSVKILLPARVDKESFLGRGTNGRQLGLALARFRYLLRVRRERVLGRLGILAAVALAGVRTALGFVEVRVATGAVDVAKRAGLADVRR